MRNEIKNLKWMNLKNMKYAKQSIGIIYFENKNEIILIGGNAEMLYMYPSSRDEETPRSFSMFEIVKNECIEYPKTSQKHSWKPAILIQNNNTIYVIGNNGMNNNRVDHPFGVIECFDIRDKRWFEIDELNKIFNSFNSFNSTNNDNKKRWFQCVLNAN